MKSPQVTHFVLEIWRSGFGVQRDKITSWHFNLQLSKIRITGFSCTWLNKMSMQVCLLCTHTMYTYPVINAFVLTGMCSINRFICVTINSFWCFLAVFLPLMIKTQNTISIITLSRVRFKWYLRHIELSNHMMSGPKESLSFNTVCHKMVRRSENTQLDLKKKFF